MKNKKNLPQRYSLDEALDDIEKTMIKNIANTIFQIYFHQQAGHKTLQTYYGWQEKFREEERSSLVGDTMKRLEAEQAILRFYKKNKNKIKQEYGTINPTGSFNAAIQRTTPSVYRQGNISEHVKEAPARESPGNEAGHAEDRGTASNGQGQAPENGGIVRAGYYEASGNNRTAGQREKQKNRHTKQIGRKEGRKGQTGSQGKIHRPQNISGHSR